MQLSLTTLFSALTVTLSLSCSVLTVDKHLSDSPRAASDHLQYPVEGKANEIFNRAEYTPASFEDRTEEVVSHAETLIKRNQEEGAVLDQRWYGLKYFGKHQELVLGAAKVRFFGGLESDVRNQLGDQYTSFDPLEEDQDSGDIRLYTGKRKEGSYDFIIIGQNGIEVALKTIIRLLYLTKFVDDESKQKYRDKLASFSPSLQVLLSSTRSRDEFIRFLTKHGIDNPDVVVIGFRGDVRSLLKDEGISDPESYTDESLRVNWYPDANGKKVLLVSIDKNRIFASRSGELIEAILAISAENLPSITLLTSSGAIDAPEMVGKIVTPTSTKNGSTFPASRDKGTIIHIIRNKAADEATIKTASVSVESVVVETTAWARDMKDLRIDTVDQELFHIMNAINSSPHAAKINVFIGTLVTDNVSSNAQNTELTLENAGKVISATSDSRRKFFSKILKKLGILNKETRWMPGRSRSPETRAFG